MKNEDFQCAKHEKTKSLVPQKSKEDFLGNTRGFFSTRKIQLVGNRSYAISLPKEWITADNLKNQDHLFIETNQNNELIIKKTNQDTKTSKSVKFSTENTDNLEEFMVFCYTRNVDNITIFKKQFDHKIEARVRHILKYLDGYAITHEDEKKIEIGFLFKEVNITIPKIIMRIYYLLKLHISSIQNSDPLAIEDAEQSVDRLYFLATRIIFSCLSNSTLRNENEIKSNEDLIYTNHIIKRMENISDQLYKLKEKKITKIETDCLNHLTDFLLQLLGGKEKPSSLKPKLIAIKPSSKDPSVESILHKVWDQCKDIFEMRISMEFSERLEKDFV